MSRILPGSHRRAITPQPVNLILKRALSRQDRPNTVLNPRAVLRLPDRGCEPQRPSARGHAAIPAQACHPGVGVPQQHRTEMGRAACLVVWL